MTDILHADWSMEPKTPCEVRITTRLSYSSAIMANPRKFSEKIALHNQKQAEETAAFEAILREVSATTKPPVTNNAPQQPQQQPQHMHLAQPNLGIYKGGSLPNVNQIAHNSIDLQNALQGLEDMKQATGRTSLVDRLHRDRSNRQNLQGHRSSRPFPSDKRVDVSPYGSAYLSPPPDTSWRRSTSDSALHTSAMGGQPQSLSGSNTPTKRSETGLNSSDVKPDLALLAWDLKNPLVQSRPKSCEVPGINIYPSPEQDSGIHIPISNNTGSLPDLSNLHFPSPMVTPLDAEEQALNNYTTNPGNLSPTTAHHMAGSGQQGQQVQDNTSPGVERRRQHGQQPSPLQLHRHTVPQQQQQLLQQQLTNMLDVNLSRLAMEHCRSMNDQQQQQQQHEHQAYSPYAPPSQHQPPSQLSQNHLTTPVSLSNNHIGQSVMQQEAYSSNHLHPNLANQTPSPSPHQHQSISTQLPLENVNDLQKGSSGPAYRNSTSDCPQSPTSPLSQTSYSPSQSPGLPPTSLNNCSSFSDVYFSHEANALQHQLEQFTMLQDSAAVQQCLFNMATVSQPLQQQQQQHQPSLQQHSATPPSIVSMASQQQQPFSPPPTNSVASMNGRVDQFSHHNSYYTHSPLPSSPLQSPQTSPSPICVISPMQIPPHSPSQHYSPLHHTDSQYLSSSQGKIPDIILTGADELSRQDFAKEISNAMAGMSDSFDSELFPSDEALKVGLDPLDLEGLKMLTDPDLVVSDPATEDSFRLDRL